MDFGGHGTGVAGCVLENDSTSKTVTVASRGTTSCTIIIRSGSSRDDYDFSVCFFGGR